jgi:hypothetical protein
MSKKALGKGLNALFSEDPVDQENDIKEVDIYHIQPLVSSTRVFIPCQ